MGMGYPACPKEHRKSVMDEQICDRHDRLLGRSSNADSLALARD